MTWKPATDAELRSLFGQPIHGLIVSRKVHDALVEHVRADSPTCFAGTEIPSTYFGIPFQVDPDLPDDEILIASTEDAWRRHLAELEARTPERIPER